MEDPFSINFSEGPKATPKAPKKRVLFAPSLEDVNKMMEAADNPRDKLIVRILAYAGLRESELIGDPNVDIPGLHLNDINWSKRRLMIRGKGWRTGKIPPIEQPIDGRTLEMIRKYVELYHTPRNGKLFDLSTRHTRHLIKKIALKAGISNAEHMSPHRLRAFFVTHIIEKFDVETARRLARHKSIASTQKYSFLAMEKVQERYDSAFEEDEG